MTSSRSEGFEYFRSWHPALRALWLIAVALWLAKLAAFLAWSYRPPFWLDILPVTIVVVISLLNWRHQRAADASRR
jgi:hypothetical protein